MAVPPSAAAAAPVPDFHQPQTLYLDNEYDIAPDSAVVIEKSDGTTILVDKADSLVHRSLAAYGMSGKTVQVNLPESRGWIDEGDTFATVRTTRVYAGSETLDLADEPMTDDIAGAEIELDGLYEDLEPGRWAIVTGERTDVRDASGNPVAGVKAAELVMLAAVTQTLRTSTSNVPLAGDTIHTFITLRGAARLHLCPRHRDGLRQRRQGHARRDARRKCSAAATPPRRCRSSR